MSFEPIGGYPPIVRREFYHEPSVIPREVPSNIVNIAQIIMDKKERALKALKKGGKDKNSKKRRPRNY